MNSYFYKIWIPLQGLTILCFFLLFSGSLSVDIYWIVLTWFFIGPVGLGVGFHRLLSHRQFQTRKPIEYILALLGTLAAYSPIAFFVGNHNYHHAYSDTNKDPSTPMKGFWESFLWWRMRTDVLKMVNVKCYCFKVFLKDDILKFMSRNFNYIIYIYVILLSLISLEALATFFIFPVFIEHLRINLISSMSHLNVPFSYRNFDTNDTSQNNYVFGILSMGFGWHNNHHKDQRQLINHHRWWELDIEGLIGYLLSKK
jgi:fatty-acid desaturase